MFEKGWRQLPFFAYWTCFPIVCWKALASYSATAQKDGFHIPDSLLVALEKNPKQDTARVEALSRIIVYYTKNRQIIQAEQYIDEVNQISEIIDNEYVNALACLYECNLLYS